MDQKFIKRNYSHIIYEILKDKTSKEGKHLSCEDIISLIKEKYNVKPDRKTIFTAIDDLIELGYDIKLEKKYSNRGYYLDNRKLNYGEFSLLVDGVESLNEIDVDTKQEIIEKMCEVIGYDYSKINFYEYDTRTNGSESHIHTSILDIINSISSAIRDGKKLLIQNTFELEMDLIDEPDDLFKEFSKTKELPINPFQLFRDKNNTLHLIYFIKYKNHYYHFVRKVQYFNEITVLDKKATKPDDFLITIDVDKINIKKEYINKQTTENNLREIEFKINFGLFEDSELYQYLTNQLNDFVIISSNGESAVKGHYYSKYEDDLNDLINEFTEDLIVKK